MKKHGVRFLTLYAFSSENWKRPKNEIFFLFKLINNYFSSEIKDVIHQGIKLNILGEINKLPKELKNTFIFLILPPPKVVLILYLLLE